MKIHKELTQEQWNKLTLCGQMANVGTDIERIINWRKRGDEYHSQGAYLRALELLEATMLDPKNKHMLPELSHVREGIIDHFQGGNALNTTDEYWNDYFWPFAWRHAFERHVIYQARIFRRLLQTSPQTPQ